MARLDAFVGEWHCEVEHVRETDEVERHVKQQLSITSEPNAHRYRVAFAPEPSAPSPAAVTSTAYWTYEEANQRFVYEAETGSGAAKASEIYVSPGPSSGTLVWTGEVRSAVSFPMRMTYVRNEGLELTTEGRSGETWTLMSKTRCTR